MMPTYVMGTATPAGLPLKTMGQKRVFNRRLRESGVPLKLCGQCGATLALGEFGKQSRNGDRYKSACRGCRSAENAKYRAEHREARREYNAKWYAANREERREYGAKYRAEHREEKREPAAKYRAEHREDRREYNAKYYAANPDRSRANSQRRRARKREATVESFTTVDLYQHWDSLGIHGCVVCGGAIDHHDHWIPLAKGGAHAVANLMPMCETHNLSKGAQHPFDFLEREIPGIFEFLAELNERRSQRNDAVNDENCR